MHKKNLILKKCTLTKMKLAASEEWCGMVTLGISDYKKFSTQEIFA